MAAAEEGRVTKLNDARETYRVEFDYSGNQCWKALPGKKKITWEHLHLTRLKMLPLPAFSLSFHKTVLMWVTPALFIAALPFHQAIASLL